MITSRLSGASRKNSTIEPTSGADSNAAWLASLSDEIVQPGAVLLLGGADVLDFHIRVAQSHLRRDLLPSFWSLAGILVSRDAFLTVPLDARLDPSRVPAANAIHECPLEAYSDASRYPNIAIVHFAAPSAPILEHARRLAGQRSAVDLPQLVVAWLGFAWGAGAAGNPLLDNRGLPSAALVETAFGIAGIELTPGIASAASCPEAIWQAALWWHEYYEKTANADAPGAGPRSARRAADERPATIVPFGAYLTRQPAAAVVEPNRTGASGGDKPAAPRTRSRTKGKTPPGKSRTPGRR